MALTNSQLGTLSKFRKESVWSLVLPIAPGASSTTAPISSVTYDAAVAEVPAVRSARPWIRLGDRVIEIHCNGQFHSFA